MIDDGQLDDRRYSEHKAEQNEYPYPGMLLHKIISSL